MAAFSSAVPSQTCVCVRVTEMEIQSSSRPLRVLILSGPQSGWFPSGIGTTDEQGQHRAHRVCWLCHPLLPPSLCPEQVPDAIKSQYQFPPPLIAPAAIRDGELICNGIPEESQTHLVNSEHLATQAEQQEVSEGRAGTPDPIILPPRRGCHWKSLSSPSSATPPSPTLNPHPCCHRPAP